MVLEEQFGVELVAPVALALVHQTCPCSGEVFLAGGGNVSRLYIAQTPGIQVEAGFSAEEFLERLPDIWNEDGYIAMGLVNPGERGKGTPVTVVPPEARPSG
jgi:hypothetical protein